jgi:pimeloyl-ACP methyl ester carboxylesterase
MATLLHTRRHCGRARAMIALAVLVLGSVAPGVSTREGSASPEMPSEAMGSTFESGFVVSGEHDLYATCAGSGSPVVLFLGGFGGGVDDWTRVMPALEKSARVCAYDRYGVGRSEVEARRPRAGIASARDLRQVIDAISPEVPVLLVGFSAGGLLARYYAATMPDDVAGLLLVDATPPEWPALRLAGASRQTRERLEVSLSGVDPTEPEPLDMLRLGYETASLDRVGAPVRMLISDVECQCPGLEGDELSRLLRGLQLGQARDLDARYEVAEKCGHAIPMECPQHVIEAVESMLSDIARDSEDCCDRGAAAWQSAILPGPIRLHKPSTTQNQALPLAPKLPQCQPATHEDPC